MAERTPTLVDQWGRPIERAVLKEEIAGPSLTGVRSHLTGYPTDGLDPVRLASILREADQGDPLRYLELAEQVEEKDPHYVGVLGTRKRSVAQIEIGVDAAGDDQASIDHADMVREWLKRDELQDELFHILDAVGKGFSATEIIWDTSAGQWRPERLEWRDPRWFSFSRADGRTPLLRDNEGDKPLPPFKFIVATITAKSGLPIRSGLARLVAWAWMFKAYTQRDWSIFTQTFGQPVRVGKFDANATPKDKDTLYRAVASIAGDCAAIIPASMEIDFIESKNVGQGAQLYKERCDWLDQQVSKAVLGQTATTDAIAGGHAVGQEHRQVQEDIERADARALSAILNRDLVRPWIDLEFGPQKAYPRLVIARPDEEDLSMAADTLQKLVPLGFRVSMQEVRDKFGWSEPNEGDEVLTAPAAQQPLAPAGEPALATQSARTAPKLDDALAALRVSGTPPVDAMLERIAGIVADAADLDAIERELARLDLPSEDLQEAMQKALALAELIGRKDLAGANG
ncbi:hypothetical protein AUC70_11770 [Methyloceanibacter stevinii]|uniref:DUF935 domain-containing protein n=1 Tax=Methyloceanibacter stevinii TaxID=1774970 RepID=A0A1E3VJ42_9HYPH|nr:DUF935 domain-containing protein [Methyloceanibacter stevinii]ODR93535.1 hypothetical protein AUC70_11770 [Methyloceanibacter stevinii]